MPSTKLNFAHELTRSPRGRGKSGKTFLLALAAVAVIAAVLIMRKSGQGSSSSTVAGSGDYYDAAGNLYDANGNLLVSASGTNSADSQYATDQYSSNLDTLTSDVDALVGYIGQQQLGGGSTGGSDGTPHSSPSKPTDIPEPKQADAPAPPPPPPAPPPPPKPAPAGPTAKQNIAMRQTPGGSARHPGVQL